MGTLRDYCSPGLEDAFFGASLHKNPSVISIIVIYIKVTQKAVISIFENFLIFHYPI